MLQMEIDRDWSFSLHRRRLSVALGGGVKVVENRFARKAFALKPHHQMNTDGTIRTRLEYRFHVQQQR